MEGLTLFWSFLKEASAEVWANKKLYLSAFLALILLGNVETIYPFLGVSEESNVFIVLTIFATLLTFVIVSQIVLIEKKKRGGVGELSFFVPTFLLYNLYYSFLFFFGLLLLVLPGLYALVFFSMVPFVAVLDDETEGKFFKKSRELVKKNIPLVVWASVINLLIECSSLLFSPIQDPIVKAVASFFYSIPDAFITIAMTIATVKVYYRLKEYP
ncbi:MAG: hypothetical protein ACXVLQ_18075 [Bacteriovorax sp.]